MPCSPTIHSTEGYHSPMFCGKEDTDLRSACRGSFFNCDNNRLCLSMIYRCNGKIDCADMSDENNCSCTSNQFKCSMGMCVASSKRCDSKNDCGDWSDEDGCPCSRVQYQCQGDGHCISRDWLCDGVKDCLEGDDEVNSSCGTCRNDQFQCSSDFSCLSESRVCDGIPDCPDSSDEHHCFRFGSYNTSNSSSGATHLVIARYRGDDWNVLCGDGWNQTASNMLCMEMGYASALETTFNDLNSISPKFLVLARLNVSSMLLKSVAVGSCNLLKAVHIRCTPQNAKVASFLTEAEYRFLRAQVKEARSAVDNRYTFAYQRLFGSAPAAEVGEEKGIKNTNSASLLATSASVPASRPPSRNEDPYGSQWEATSKRGSDAQLSDLRLSVVRRRTPTAPQPHATQKRGSNNHRRTRLTPSRNSSEVDLAELGRLLTITKARTDIRSVYDASRTSTPFRFSHDTRSTYDTLRSVTPFRISLCDLNFERAPTKLKLVNSSEVTGTVDDQEELDLDGVDTGSTLSEGRMEMISKKTKLECTLVDGQSEMAKEAVYKFASPLSKDFMQLDLEILSRSERDWRLQTMIRPSNRTEEMIIDRLIQMEKLQALTVEMERGGTGGAGKKGRTVGTVYQNQPKITSKTSLTGSRKVQNDNYYVQSWLDDEICPNCMDRHTVKSCLENAYESRCRVPVPSTMTRNGVTNKTDMTSCRQSNNLSSSKSIQSRTFESSSRCGPSPSTDELASTSELVRHFKLLGVRLDGSGKPPGSVSTGRPNSRARCPAGGGRASLVPGKSYKSQRKFSLTDTTPTPKPTQRLKSAAARLGKSGNRKRPQTAV